jgi:hypothetical protein
MDNYNILLKKSNKKDIKGYEKLVMGILIMNSMLIISLLTMMIIEIQILKEYKLKIESSINRINEITNTKKVFGQIDYIYDTIVPQIEVFMNQTMKCVDTVCPYK